MRYPDTVIYLQSWGVEKMALSGPISDVVWRLSFGFHLYLVQTRPQLRFSRNRICARN